MKLNGMPQWFLRTKPGIEAVAESQAEAHSAREAAAAEIPKLHADAAPRLEELDALVPSLEKEVQVARQALHEAKDTLQTAENEARSIRISRDSRVQSLQALLRTTAPPEILAFKAWCQAEWERVRRTHPARAFYGERNLSGQRMQVNNYPSILERMDGLRAASKEAERLALDPCVDGEIVARLEQIREKIPQIRSPWDFVPEGALPLHPVADEDPPAPRKSWALHGSADR